MHAYNLLIIKRTTMKITLKRFQTVSHEQHSKTVAERQRLANQWLRGLSGFMWIEAGTEQTVVSTAEFRLQDKFLLNRTQ